MESTSEMEDMLCYKKAPFISEQIYTPGLMGEPTSSGPTLVLDMWKWTKESVVWC